MTKNNNTESFDSINEDDECRPDFTTNTDAFDGPDAETEFWDWAGFNLAMDSDFAIDCIDDANELSDFLGGIPYDEIRDRIKSDWCEAHGVDPDDLPDEPDLDPEERHARTVNWFADHTKLHLDRLMDEAEDFGEVLEETWFFPIQIRDNLQAAWCRAQWFDAEEENGDNE